MNALPWLRSCTRIGLIVALAAYSRFFLAARMLELGDHGSFMHRVHLVFHEAGHALLFWAPPILTSLGGTLGQLIVPLALAVAFAVKNRDGFAASVCGWWLGHSLVDVAPYINDARTLRLMLLGGGTGDEIEGHDWNFILGQLDLLKMDVRLAHGVLLSGRLIMVVALLAAVLFVVRECLIRLRPGVPGRTATGRGAR